jgi:ATP-dependent helicase HrpB
MQRRELPIFELEHALTAALRQTPRVISEALTGSGKSTQVPQILLDHGLLGEGEVVVLQPRRLPARMLANRVASERGGRTGKKSDIKSDSTVCALRRLAFAM